MSLVRTSAKLVVNLVNIVMCIDLDSVVNELKKPVQLLCK